ncbi:MAG TPA: hypothetical protein VEJ67_06470 [Candidatus Cybelea sp.]|nr:hypothetical protein [Candidatus Cybelea sp.]
MTALTGWENFYVIVGSSAGALIGLQFVVITLIANRPILEGQAEAGAAFATPTIVHFAAVLLLAAIQTSPWRGLGALAVLWCVLGLSGLAYEIVVARRMRKQTAYTPEFEDWLFHALLPCAAYVTLAGSGLATGGHARKASFAVAAAALLLLFIGIHNAWDAVTYHIFFAKQGETKARSQ